MVNIVVSYDMLIISSNILPIVKTVYISLVIILSLNTETNLFTLNNYLAYKQNIYLI